MSVSVYTLDSVTNSTALIHFIIQLKAISQHHSIIETTAIDLKFGKIIAIHLVFSMAYGEWGMATHKSKSLPSENICLPKNNISSACSLLDTPC